MEKNVDVLKSLGLCQLCKHNIYEDKKHPTWMSCHCVEPVVEVIAASPSTLYYDVDC